MKVTVKLIGSLIYKAGFSEKKVELPASATVGAAIALAKLGKYRQVIMTVNGRAAGPANVLRNGDRLAVSPIYSGG